MPPMSRARTKERLTSSYPTSIQPWVVTQCAICGCICWIDGCIARTSSYILGLGQKVPTDYCPDNWQGTVLAPPVVSYPVASFNCRMPHPSVDYGDGWRVRQAARV